MEQLRIVRYEPDLAAAVADMWNDSHEGWGGGSTVMTAQQIVEQESASDALLVQLAMIEDVVVGYMSLSEYREDTGALYINLLNVRPSYHGHKIGKQLVLEAVKETVRLGWPRLDLYTWAGNTKAVPLYKKCGFFWNDRDDCTHFMNFMPSILQTEAVAAYFNQADWYTDSIRPIAIERDGKKENGFDYYEYAWNHHGSMLRIEFEQRGRGLRLIETDDYMVEATVECAELVFGRRYQIAYRLVNKTDNPLHIRLQGMDDEHISFAWTHDTEVSGECVLHASFDVEPIAERQNDWRTHPGVRTNVWINGLHAELKIGVLTNYPASIQMHVPSPIGYLNRPAQLYLDVENHGATEMTYTFELPAQPHIQFEQRFHSISLAAKGKTSIPVAYRLCNFGFYTAILHIQARQDNGSELSFEYKVSAGFTGLGARVFGETETEWQLMHGKFQLLFDKGENTCSLVKLDVDDSPIELDYPRLGKPFSSEFSKKKPDKVEDFEQAGAYGLKMSYRSESFAQLVLYSYTLLYGDGTVKHWFEVENTSTTASTHDLWLEQSIYDAANRVMMPYEGRAMAITDYHGSDYGYWDASKVSESWLIYLGLATMRGVCWSPRHQLRFERNSIALDIHIGPLSARETKACEPMYFLPDNVTDWKQWRAFALQQFEQDEPIQSIPLVRSTELIVNGHNPFVQGDIPIEVKDYKLLHWEGEISVSCGEHMHSETYAEEDEATCTAFVLPLPLSTPNNGYASVQMNARFTTHDSICQSVVFAQSQQQIALERTTEAEHDVFSADNGTIRIKAAPTFFPGLFSLTFAGEEWLDSSFPQLTPKSWWNPWAGGITTNFNGLSNMSLIKEERTAHFVQLTDNKQNKWQGIRVSYEINQHKSFKGLTCHQYFVLLPGVPVLALTSQIEQHTGTYFNEKECWVEIFVKLVEQEESGWAQAFTSTNEALTFRLGEDNLEVTEQSEYVLGSEERRHIMQVVTDLSADHSILYLNQEVCKVGVSRNIHVAHRDSMWTTPTFIMFGEQKIPSGALDALKAIRFSMATNIDEQRGG
ncbi:GNAT family N-acetyltransferase [Paenibacillus sp. 481]|uniref:GNAT family N-acetyltransferase n=1 Tax=Paenibacillus sp. 481 TaxID=2835869 RepID=UPI001E4C40B7|nr:GNAT family N-acetyltransferase [Paenibacillus sp. 481]UHA73563.1 GNAT family N-acetyltransferase [Paenibacillus sp. 481]